MTEHDAILFQGEGMEQKMEALLQSWDGELLITHYHQATNAL
jgi:hypothetical protein